MHCFRCANRTFHGVTDRQSYIPSRFRHEDRALPERPGMHSYTPPRSRHASVHFSKIRQRTPFSRARIVHSSTYLTRIRTFRRSLDTRSYNPMCSRHEFVHSDTLSLKSSIRFCLQQRFACNCVSACSPVSACSLIRHSATSDLLQRPACNFV